MKLFLDTANVAIVSEWAATGIIDGITTNPSNLSKESGDFKKLLHELCSLVPGHVSIEIVAKEPQHVLNQAREIADFAPNVVVKIPFAKEYLGVIKELVDAGIAVNVTLIFSLVQALLVAKLGVTYISPFIGRLDEIDSNGMLLISEIREMLDLYAFNSQLLAASIRSVHHVHEAILIGADAITVPPSLLEPLMNHPLTERGIKKFDEDWKKTSSSSFFK